MLRDACCVAHCVRLRRAYGVAFGTQSEPAGCASAKNYPTKYNTPLRFGEFKSWHPLTLKSPALLRSMPGIFYWGNEQGCSVLPQSDLTGFRKRLWDAGFGHFRAYFSLKTHAKTCQVLELNNPGRPPRLGRSILELTLHYKNLGGLPCVGEGECLL